MMYKLMIFSLIVLATGTAQAADYVWLECEEGARADFEWQAQGVEIAGVLSGGKWLMMKEQAKTVPEEGWNVSYDMSVLRAGEYRLWLRIGFEKLRPGVFWKIDDGAWTKIGLPLPSMADPSVGVNRFDRHTLTTNVKELGFWQSVAWWDLGFAELSKGEHTLHLKFVDSLAGRTPILAIDSICLVEGPWTPEGKLKPGETYRAEADIMAAQKVYELPGLSAGAERVQVDLAGPWQVARYDDPDMDVDTYEPVRKIPGPEEYDLKWMGVTVPHKDLWQHPELSFAHRVIYRTRVNVPAAHKGRGFKLHFAGTNWIVSVFVNGRLVGDHKSVWIPWDLDVSRFIKPGEINEIEIAVKGHYYAWDTRFHHLAAKSLNNIRELPYDIRRPRGHPAHFRFIAPIFPSTIGDGDGYLHGIVNPVYLVSVGQAYVEDVFIKPSVARQSLETEVTVRNVTGQDASYEVHCEAVHDPDKSNSPERTFGPLKVFVRAGETATVSVIGPWEDPKLWWPKPNPDLYRLRTKVTQDGRLIDIQEELFGFREITVKGTGIYINGIRRNLWNWASPSESTPGKDWVERWRNEGSRFLRFTYENVKDTNTRCREEYLEVFDREGVPGQLCSMVDGSGRGSFEFGEWAETAGAEPREFVPNEPLWSNLREHVAQMVKAYRNHPCVITYQLSNELVYNARMPRPNLMPYLAEETFKMFLAARAIDSTRPYAEGGGGDLSFAHGFEGRRLDINCLYDPLAPEDWYPDDAYRVNRYDMAIGRREWDRTNPWFSVENVTASATDLGTYVGGAVALRYQEDARRAKAKFVRALYEGYRWGDVAAFSSQDNLSEFEDGRKVFSSLIAIPRKRTYRLQSGQENSLHFKIMNDTFSRDPVTLRWQYRIDGKEIAGATETLAIEPGFGEEQWLTVKAPATPRRLDGVLTLKVWIPGELVFEDSMSIPVLPSPVISTAVPVLVYDKPGNTKSFLSACGVEFIELGALAELDDREGLLIVGHDTLTADEAAGSDVLKFASRGNQVICLEQDNPLSGTNLPVSIKATDRFGGYAHPQALGTALFDELRPDDFSDWAGDHPTYKNAYTKPSMEARSLIECGPKLPWSALIECRADDGFILLCQLRVGAKLGVEPAAGILLRNMIGTYAGKRPSTGRAALFAPGNALLTDKVNATGVLCEPVTELTKALDTKAYKAVIVDGAQQNLQQLLELKAAAESFQEQGGWIMVCGVSPEGLELFNRFMGTKHLLRPFRPERVYIEKTDHPLAATLHDETVVQFSTVILRKWFGIYWLSPDVFSWVIDTYDAAPFTIPPGAGDDPYSYKPTWDETDPYNVVNGMLNETAWQYTHVFKVLKKGETDQDGMAGPVGLEQVFKVRRPETIRQINVWNSTLYSTIEKMDIVFDDDTANAVSTVLASDGRMNKIVLPYPMTAEKTITFVVRSWRENKAHQNPGASHLVGIDNVQFIRAQHISHGITLDNVGGLTVFPRGQGGVFLNQVKFMANEDEPNLINAAKKVDLARIILKNMGIAERTEPGSVVGDAADVSPAAIRYGRVGEWAGFGGPGGTCTAPDTGLLNVWPEAGPRELWSVQVGEGYGGVTIRDEEVYLLDREVAKADILRCFDLSSGTEKWRLLYDAPGKLPHPGSRSHPAVDKTHVFVVSPLGDLRCVDRATHEIVWMKEYAKDVRAAKPTWGFAQTPLLTGDLVVVAPVGEEASALAYKKTTGEVVWKSDVIDGSLGYTSPMLANIEGVEQVLILTSGATTGLDAKTGETLWRSFFYKCNNPIPSPVHLMDGFVFLTGGYGAGCSMLKIRKQGTDFEVSPVFKNRNLTSQIHQPLYYQGYIYGNSNEASRKKGFVCLDLEGNVKWQTGGKPDFGWGGALIADGKIYAVDGSSGDLCMIRPDPSGYREIGRAKLLSTKPIWATIAMADGKILLRDYTNLKCVDVRGDAQ